MIAEGKSGSNGNTMVTDGSGLNFNLFYVYINTSCINQRRKRKTCYRPVQWR